MVSGVCLNNWKASGVSSDMLNVSYSHTDKDVKQANGCMLQGVRRKLYTEDVNLRVIYIQIPF